MRLPYNFVPFTPYVLQPSWAPLVSHDRPFQDGYRGEIEVSFTNVTPICAAGEQQASNERDAGLAKFFRVGPNETPALPNTAIKGMLRAAMKAITFGKQDQVQDRRFAVRDISQAGNFYFNHLQSSQTRGGFLRFDQEKGHWYIVPCEQIYRAHQNDILEALSSDESERSNLQQRWNDKIGNNSISSVQRYKIIGGIKEVEISKPFKRDKDHRMGVDILTFKNGTGNYLVVTGQPGRVNDFRVPKNHNYEIDYTNPNKSAKKWEFVFSNPDEENQIVLSKGTVKDFLFVHNESSEWQFLKAKLTDKQFLPMGIPVFYLPSSSDVQHLGLACMYRLPYTFSTHELIKRQDPRHLDAKVQDLAELIFGYSVDDSDQHGLRSRVNISHALPEQTFELTDSEATVLGEPKPSFYPSYLQQTEGNNFTSYMDKNILLSGQKFYSRTQAQLPPPPDRSTTRVQIRLEFAPKNITWKAKIRFHNLRAVELGALLWTLNLSGKSVHQLGLAKAFGYGQLKTEADINWVKANDPNQPTLSSKLATAMFEDYMNQASATLFRHAEWLKTPTMKKFMELTTPSSDRASPYPGPRVYQNSKRRGGQLHNYTDANSFTVEVNNEDVDFYPDLEAKQKVLDEEVAKKAE
ncbi:TIGR03986 family type III CRISPR-associated RAMP protein [Vibrio metschnikovii]|uniref:TIGR03986 family type III CRISPR-associated RAMP protein n=1 Tax=Vibrio metschnikovii TaxID=28172 RepID=UPI001C30CCAB|nr:TIGR03986 family CRISPR-associated RAMP protein [Vibrio metschnikovii]